MYDCCAFLGFEVPKKKWLRSSVLYDLDIPFMIFNGTSAIKVNGGSSLSYDRVIVLNRRTSHAYVVSLKK